MSSNLKNLSSTNLEEKTDTFSKSKIGIVVAEWNSEITFAMRDAAIDYLTKLGVKPKNILISYVPGAFELAFGANLLAESKKHHAIISIGCVIKGETPHFDFISNACANGIMQVGLTHNIPTVFGVLTTNNLEQAQARSGGKHGNKGVEAAETALKMISFSKEISTK